jgi:signal transduction histidine kinase
LAGITLNPIKEMVDEQNRFISDASHEINTPLTSLKLAMEVFLRKKNVKVSESRQLIKESIEEVNKLQTLSKSLLQLAKYQSRNGNIGYEMVDISEVIEEAIKKTALMAKAKGISVRSSVERMNIRANKFNIIELFVNLIDNAIKYSRKGGLVEVYTRKEHDNLLVFVKDYGIGISEKDLPHIFDRFYRADTSRSKEVSAGYGLGLSIAKKVAQAHGGKIEVKSKPGEGSTFIVSMPLSR